MSDLFNGRIRRMDSVVVTTIASPNPVLLAIARQASQKAIPFYAMGDRKSPASFVLDGCHFFSLESQRALPFAYAGLCPEASYTRKNIGYLLAMSKGAQSIIETDDDNFPEEDFLSERSPVVSGRQPEQSGWINTYAYFSDLKIWPRGFPLERVQSACAASVQERTGICPIQQGLANENPDIDAIYRLVLPLPVFFEKKSPLILTQGQWCPFNSQSTVFFSEAFPLLYLPATCSFRITDIWRSFVAQRILWTCGWNLSFHSASVRQERNEHNLMRDFSDEISGYLNNAKIAENLEKLEMKPGRESMPENLRICYEELLRMELVKPEELRLLDAWLGDLKRLGI